MGVPNVDNIFAEIKPELLSPKDIKGGKIKFKGGDIIFARIEPSIYNRKTALVPKSYDEVLGSTELYVVRTKKEYDNGYLLWALRSKLTQNQILGKMTGSTGRRRLPHTDFGNLMIPFVKREKQSLIAKHYLKSLSKAKNLRGNALKNLKKVRLDLEKTLKKKIN